MELLLLLIDSLEILVNTRSWCHCCISLQMTPTEIRLNLLSFIWMRVSNYIFKAYLRVGLLWRWCLVWLLLGLVWIPTISCNSVLTCSRFVCSSTISFTLLLNHLSINIIWFQLGLSVVAQVLTNQIEFNIIVFFNVFVAKFCENLIWIRSALTLSALIKSRKSNTGLVACSTLEDKLLFVF